MSGGAEPGAVALAGAVVAGVSFYAAGMAANDFVDREIDLVARPHRPIPAKEISARGAAALVAGLAAIGLVASAAAGALVAGGAVLALALLYDFGTKRVAILGAATIAAARGANLALGAAAADGPVPWWAALVLAAYVFVLALASRAEERPPASRESRAWLAAHLAVLVLAAASCSRALGLVPLAGLGVWLATAYRSLDPGRIVRTGVVGVLLLDSSFLLGAGQVGAGVVAALLVLGPWLAARTGTISGMGRD